MSESVPRGVYALQHCDSEFLGLVEDHLEGRGIRFQYVRPFVAGGTVPGTAAADGLVLMGGGGWGAAGDRVLPSLAAELRLTRDFLKRRKPVVAWGLGAQLLCLAAGGGAETGGLVFDVVTVRRTAVDALGGYLPESAPLTVFMRGRPKLPDGSRVLAVDAAGGPAIFQVGDNGFGFAGHPGMKPGMAEDLVMEFDEPLHDWSGAPVDAASTLARARAAQAAIADALVPLMTGLIQATGLMRPLSEAERRRRSVIPIGR